MCPKISIIITTYNRAGHLRETLASLAKAQVPSGLPPELLVVDNASTDDTAEVVKIACLPQMPVRYLFEGKRGISNARNSGLANTTGEIILFTDDDVRVPPAWIESMARLILEGGADAVGGGVRLAPHLLRPWMTSRHRAYLAEIGQQYYEDGDLMVGANMAFHRRVLDKVPRFDPHLGTGALGFAEETLFRLQLLGAGFRLRSLPETEVEHHIDPSRLQRGAFLSTAAKKGRSEAYLQHHWFHRHVARPTGADYRRLLWDRWLVVMTRGRILSREGCPNNLLKAARAVASWEQFEIESGTPPRYA